MQNVHARIDGTVSNLAFDQNYRSDKITIAGNEYQKGINAYLSAFEKSLSVDYNFNGKFKKFTGNLGIDDHTKNSIASVKISFIGDGNEIAQYSVKGGDIPLPVTIDLTGVLKLQIKFEYQNGDVYSDVYGAIGEAKVFN